MFCMTVAAAVWWRQLQRGAIPCCCCFCFCFCCCKCNWKLVQCHLSWIVPFIRHYYWNGLFLISWNVNEFECNFQELRSFARIKPNDKNEIIFLFISLSVFVNASRCQYVVKIIAFKYVTTWCNTVGSAIIVVCSLCSRFTSPHPPKKKKQRKK